MSEQIDIAVDLGVLPPPLPEIEFLRDFALNLPAPPAEMVDGILHQGCKMILGGTSKSNKSWCLLDLAMSVASGQPWWGLARTSANRHGNWGREAALWLGRRAGRLPLAELGKLAGGLDYALVSKAIARFGRRWKADAGLRREVAAIQDQLSK